MPTSFSTASRLAMTACLLSLTLTACQKSGPNGASTDTGQPTTAPPIAALPLATAAPTAPIAYAPAATALPSGATHIRLSLRHDRERYGYTDRAYAVSSAFGDTPPDYTVDYEGTRPWVWRSDDGGYRVVEQLPDGQRTYYYARGADTPFYITDPYGGYAYDNGALVGIYGPDGRPLPDAYAQRWADKAARYYDRSQAIYHAAQYGQRQAAYADDWRARRDRLAQQQQRWDAARSHDADWQSWHDQHSQDEDRVWHGEQDRRAAYAAAIGAAIVGTATLISGNHAGDHQNLSGPPAGNRPNDGVRPSAPTFGGGDGQRPNANPQPSGNREAPRVQQQPARAVQHPWGRPVPAQSPQAAFGTHPQNLPQPQAQRVPLPVPARLPMPARQNPINRGAVAPSGSPAASTHSFMKPQAPAPSHLPQPLAEPHPRATIRPTPTTAEAANRPHWPAPAAAKGMASDLARPRPNGVAPTPVPDRGHHAPPGTINPGEHQAPAKDAASPKEHPHGRPPTAPHSGN